MTEHGNLEEELHIAEAWMPDAITLEPIAAGITYDRSFTADFQIIRNGVPHAETGVTVDSVELVARKDGIVDPPITKDTLKHIIDVANLPWVIEIRDDTSKLHRVALKIAALPMAGRFAMQGRGRYVFPNYDQEAIEERQLSFIAFCNNVLAAK
jgi:hypothetical protein